MVSGTPRAPVVFDIMGWIIFIAMCRGSLQSCFPVSISAVTKKLTMYFSTMTNPDEKTASAAQSTLHFQPSASGTPSAMDTQDASSDT